MLLDVSAVGGLAVGLALSQVEVCAGLERDDGRLGEQRQAVNLAQIGLQQLVVGLVQQDGRQAGTVSSIGRGVR